jgi:hypothetical protein
VLQLIANCSVGKLLKTFSCIQPEAAAADPFFPNLMIPYILLVDDFGKHHLAIVRSEV